GIAADRHGLPLLVRAPHRALWFRLLHPFPCHELKDDFDRGGVSGAQQYGRARDLLDEAFFELKEEAAPGVDGLTWAEYEQNLDRNIEDLHARVHRGAYRALPSRRVYIPKPDGRQRPLAVAALEDKIVQRATAAVL